MKENKTEKQEKGLGDVTKEVIKKVMPKTAKKLEDCEGCEQRRKKLNEVGLKVKAYMKNNFNANFG